MVNFSDEHKAEKERGSYFKEGIHIVKISSFVFDKTAAGKEYVEFEVFDPLNEETTAKARFWFTTDGAINYTFSQLRNIFIHNAPKDKKDAVRAKFNKIENTDQLEKELQMLIGKECWLQVSADGTTYEGKNGKVYPNLNSDLFGYEPASKDTFADMQSAHDPIKTDDENGNEQLIATF